jgi:Tol biopolymer transport system component
MARPRWTRTIIALGGTLFLGALVALSPEAKGSGYADGLTGTPSYLPLAMKQIPTPTPGAWGRIVFESDRVTPDHFEIYSMKANGSDVKRLTYLGQYSRDASWSPDYGRIVFDSGPRYDDALRELWVMNADGTGLQRLTNNSVYDWDPSWSPDGTSIAFTSGPIGKADIWLMDTSTWVAVKLTDWSGADLDPCWSPDSAYIAFTSDRYGSNYNIYRMNRYGGEVLRLTDDPADDTDPSWSSDGTRIAFESNRGSRSEIWVMNAYGSPPTNLSNWPGLDLDPSWLVGAERIVFNADRVPHDDDMEVYIMNSDGTGQTRLTYATGTDGDACARPGCP